MGNNGKGLLAALCCALLMLALPVQAFASGGAEIEAKYNIVITAPTALQGDSAFVTVALEDVNGTGYVTAEARLGQDGDWLDITGELRAHGMAAVEVRGNGVFYVAVTDHTGYAHVQAEAVECFSDTVATATTSNTTTQSAIPSGTPDSNPFTPEGTGTVLDNATDGDEKEFFTITTADENVFYLIVDRQRNSENVYFLNAVTEDDLLSLAQPGSSSNASVIPVDEPEPVPEPEPDPDPEPEAKKSNSGSLLFILIAVAGVGGAGYYFKILKPRQEAADGDDEDEDEYDDYDDAYPDDEPDYPDEEGDPADGGLEEQEEDGI